MKYFFRCFSVSKDDVIGCYWPIQDELDTRPLISELIKKKNQNSTSCNIR